MMRARTLIGLSITSALVFCGTASVAYAATLPVELRLINTLQIPTAPYGTYQSAFKPGDTFSLIFSSFNNDLTLTADLSALGVSTTTIGAPRGPFYGTIAGITSPNVFTYQLGPITVGSVPDGLKNISVSGTGPGGNTGTASLPIDIDTAPPELDFSDISLSATPPDEGDTIDFSGTSNGTGSALQISRLSESAFKSGTTQSATGCGGDVNYDYAGLNAAIEASPDGSFSHVRVPIFECGHPGSLAQADSLTITATAYDEAGNTVTINKIVPFVTTPKISNVLFLPGTEASRLYYRDFLGLEHQVWEPDFLTDIPHLLMNPDGTSKENIYTKDIVDSLESHNPLYSTIAGIFGLDNLDVYGGFENFMDALVASSTSGLKEWKAYPYDWRYDVKDIVQDGTMTETADGSIERVYLEDVLRGLASTSPTGKVTIVAHSNGGLLAKALALHLGSDASTYIDRIILIGTPQWGTPSDIGVMLHGDGQTQAFGIVMNSAQSRAAAATLPDAYDLLPSPAYFAHTTVPVVTFADDNSLAGQFGSAYGHSIDSFSSFSDFLSDTAHLDASAGDSNNLRAPLPLSSSLIAKAEATHADLDAWTPPPGISVTAIAGWGQDTIQALDYSTKNFSNCAAASIANPNVCSQTAILEHTPIFTQDGDGTVISQSALGTNPNTLYFNSIRYRNDGYGDVTHQNLTSSTALLSFLKNLLSGLTDQGLYLSQQKPNGSTNPITVLSSHSPVNLLATDSFGNKTGFIPIPGSDFSMPVHSIPGSSVQILDDEEYLLLPADETYSVVAHGYADGFATLDTDSLSSSGGLLPGKSFENIPITASTSIFFQVVQGDSSNPQVDVDGDGSVDISAISDSPDVDPVSYVAFMQASIDAMDMDKKAKKELNLELAGTKLLLDLEEKTHGEAARQKIRKLVLASLEVFERTVDLFVQNSLKSRNKQPQLQPIQAGGILDMLNMLRSLI